MRCCLSIILLMILLVGCVSPNSTVEVGTVSSPAVESETPTPTVTQTPSYVYVQDPTKTPQPTFTPTYDPFVDPTVRYQDGVIPPFAHRRLGMGLIGDLEVSPDRQPFAVGTTTGVYVFDSQTYDLLWSAGTRAPIGEINWFTFGGIEWSPSGDKLAVALPDTDSILVWDADGQFLVKLEQSNLSRAFDWSPDGKQIVTAQTWFDISGQIHSAVTTWNVNTGEESGFYEIDTSQDIVYLLVIESVQWSPDGRYVVVGTQSPYMIPILDLAAGKFLELKIPEEISHKEIKYLEFSPDGSRLLSFSGWRLAEGPAGSAYAVIWDMESLEMVYALKPEQVPTFWQVSDAGWSPNGQYVAAIYVSQGSSSVFVIWEAATGKNIFMYEDEAYHLNSLGWSPDGTIVTASGSILYNNDNEDEGALFMVDLGDMDHIAIEKEVAHSPEYSGWLSDNQLLVASVEDLYVRDMPTDRYTTIIGSGRKVLRLAQSPDSSVIAALQHNRSGIVETVTYWDIQAWERLEHDQENLPPDDWLYSNSNRYELAALTNYTYILDQPTAGGAHGEWETINIKLLASGRTILDYSETDAYVYSNAVSMDGRYMAFGFGYPDCYVCQVLSRMEQAYILLFDTETETYVTLYGHTGRVTSLLFLPDGDLISGSTDGTIIVWDIPQT